MVYGVVCVANKLSPHCTDGNVYVWRSGKEKPALVLRGHSRTVNCVAWDPVHHTTLASASDDGMCVGAGLHVCYLFGCVCVLQALCGCGVERRLLTG